MKPFFCLHMAVKSGDLWETDETFEYVVKLQNKAIYFGRYKICHNVPLVAILLI